MAATPNLVTPEGELPLVFDDYLSVTKDGLPPLYPHAPHWIYDDRLKKQICSTLEGFSSSERTEWLLEPYTHQRKLDACWRCFTAAVHRSSEVEELPVKRWVDEVLTPTGWKISQFSNDLRPTMVMTVVEFQRKIAGLMQHGGLELLPASGPPRESQGLCDECGTPCISECICGEAFCSRACLKKSWPTHRAFCEAVVENTELGQVVTYKEMLSPLSPRQCDAWQCLGHKPWRGGLLRGQQAPTTSRPASVPPPSNDDPARFVGQDVVLMGLVAKPELNGRSGRVISWRADKERLVVSVEDAKPMMVKPANMVLASGTRCAECRETRAAVAFDASELAKGSRARCHECLAMMEPRRKQELEHLEVLLNSGQEPCRRLAEMRLSDPPAKPPCPRSGEQDTAWSQRLEAKHAHNAQHNPLIAEVYRDWSIATKYELMDHFRDELRAAGESPPTAEQAVRCGACALLWKHQACSICGDGMRQLCAAAERFIKDVSKSASLRADACVVLSHMALQKRDVGRALKHIDMADNLRPNDAHILSSRATVHANRDSKALALQDLLRARELMRSNPGPHAAIFLLERTGEIGKSLHGLRRLREAQPELEKYVELTFSAEFEERLTDNERCHAIVAQYMLAGLHAEQGEKARATEVYDLAQERENHIDPDEHRRIDWGQKVVAQVHIAHQADQDEAALRLAAERERERKAAEASMQPLDASLDPVELYAEAVRLANTNMLTEAAWRFLVTLFLSWRYHDLQLLQPVAAVIRALQAGAAPLPPWVAPLATIVHSLQEGAIMITNQRFQPLFERAIREADENLTRRAIREADQNLTRRVDTAAATDIVPAGGVLAGEDRLAFSRACACLFWTRDLMALFSNQPNRDCAYQAQQATAHVSTHLKPQRYLTVLFELAYTNRAVHAMDEAARWSEAFTKALPRSPNAHWAFIQQRNTDGQATAEEAYTTVQGAQTRVFARKILEASERALASASSSERASEGDVLRAEAGIMQALALLRSLPADDQNPELVMRAVDALAASTGARPATAARAAVEIEGVLSTARGFDEASAVGASARISLESVRRCVPEERRWCKACGEHKSRVNYSDNQWRKGQRRCKACQSAGITTTATQRTEAQAAEEEASTLRALYQQHLATEERRVKEELARRNANEHSDADCAICFDETAPEERLMLHGTMHWLCAGCLKEMLAINKRPIHCHMCKEELDDDKLRSMLVERG